MNSKAREKAAVLSNLAEMNRIWNGLQNWSDQLFGSIEKPSLCFMVTSAQSGEGKTTLTASMAQFLGRSVGKRVLAMDGNWYRPALSSYFGVSPSWHLEEFRQHQKRPIVSTDMKEVDLLPAPVLNTDSMPSTAELSETAIRLLNTYRNQYDCVLIDASSLLPTNRSMVDPVVIGHSADAAILLVLTHVTPRQQVKRAQKMLESSGTAIAGIVINHREESHS